MESKLWLYIKIHKGIAKQIKEKLNSLHSAVAGWSKRSGKKKKALHMSLFLWVKQLHVFGKIKCLIRIAIQFHHLIKSIVVHTRLGHLTINYIYTPTSVDLLPNKIQRHRKRIGKPKIKSSERLKRKKSGYMLFWCHNREY